MYYIGIDLGGTNIAAGIVNIHGEILLQDSIATGAGRNYIDISNDMVKLSKDLIKKAGLSIDEIDSIGIGAPGVLDRRKGVVINSCNLNFVNAPVAEAMKYNIDLPIYMENDANCAALAETYYGASKGTKFSIMITLGTGVGSGIIMNNRIYSGFNYAAGELGHVVIKLDGEDCNCGRKGCWEAYSSATALIRQARSVIEAEPETLINEIIDRNLANLDAKAVFDAADRNDIIAKRIVEKYIDYLADGIANVINIFQPEMIVIGGGISKQEEKLLTPLRVLVGKRVYTREGMPQTQIKVASAGNGAGIIGAALLATQISEDGH